MIRSRLACLLAVFATLCLVACDRGLGNDQHGQPVTASSLKGQWLVINYWAEWCGPCRREIPELNQFVSRMANEDVQVLGVNFDQVQGQALAQAADGMGIHYRVLAEDPADALDLPKAEGLPVTFVLDPQRKVRATLLGEQTAAGLAQRLVALKAGG